MILYALACDRNSAPVSHIAGCFGLGVAFTRQPAQDARRKVSGPFALVHADVQSLLDCVKSDARV